MKTRLSKSKLHFIGIGGIGMSGLAELLLNTGALVTGSDLSDNVQTQRLSNLGIQIYREHKSENIGDAGVVVYSSAIRPTNPEFAEAKRKGIPLISRAEALAELMLLKRGIAIAGTHGKTTVTSLVSSLFVQADLDPTIVVGGRLECIDSTAQLGTGAWLVAEADESDGSFNRLSPEVVVVTNVDDDHLDYYGSTDNLYRAFSEFGSRIPFFGRLVICGDDGKLQNIFSEFTKRKITYGFESHNTYVLKPQGQAVYHIEFNSQVITKFKCPMPGKHNALNAMAALICGHIAEIPWEKSCKLIQNFDGVDRRFQLKGEVNGAPYYDDYGHHPTEVKAVLQALREKFPDKNLKVMFQPHRYTRTKDCWDDFLSCFSEADELLLMKIYPASEDPIPGITTEELIKSMKHKNVALVAKTDEAIDQIKASVSDQDVLLTLGAGDISRWGEGLIK